MRRLRVKASSRNGGWTVIQKLQEKRWWGWHTIDREEVPHYAVVSLGCFGDAGGWVSKFREYGPFGRDGVINQPA